MIHVYKFNFFEENYYKYRTLLKTNVRKAKIMTRKLTFNLPNTNERYLKGNARGYGAESLPNIKGTIKYSTYTEGASGAISKVSGQGKAAAVQFNEYGVGSVKLDASSSSSTYQDGAKVNPDHVYVNFIIKY